MMLDCCKDLQEKYTVLALIRLVCEPAHLSALYLASGWLQPSAVMHHQQFGAQSWQLPPLR